MTAHTALDRAVLRSAGVDPDRVPVRESEIRVGDRVWIDPAFGYDQPASWEVRSIEDGAACLVGAGWFDLNDLTKEDNGG